MIAINTFLVISYLSLPRIFLLWCFLQISTRLPASYLFIFFSYSRYQVLPVKWNKYHLHTSHKADNLVNEIKRLIKFDVGKGSAFLFESFFFLPGGELELFHHLKLTCVFLYLCFFTSEISIWASNPSGIQKWDRGKIEVLWLSIPCSYFSDTIAAKKFHYLLDQCETPPFHKIVSLHIVYPRLSVSILFHYLSLGSYVIGT